jgi:hypothetical protein
MSAIVENFVQTDGVGFSYIFGSFIDDDIPFRDIDLGVYFYWKQSFTNV